MKSVTLFKNDKGNIEIDPYDLRELLKQLQDECYMTGYIEGLRDSVKLNSDKHDKQLLSSYTEPIPTFDPIQQWNPYKITCDSINYDTCTMVAPNPTICTRKDNSDIYNTVTKITKE